jgi:hypothetical protein
MTISAPLAANGASEPATGWNGGGQVQRRVRRAS